MKARRSSETGTNAAMTACGVLLGVLLMALVVGLSAANAAPADDGGTPLSLRDAVERALARDALVRDAQQALDSARAALTSAKAYTPTASLSSSTSSSKTASIDPQSALTDPGWPGLEDSFGGTVPDVDGPAPWRLKAALRERVQRVATRFRWLTGTLQQFAGRVASETYAMSVFASPASLSPLPSPEPGERLPADHLAYDVPAP